MVIGVIMLQYLYYLKCNLLISVYNLYIVMIHALEC